MKSLVESVLVVEDDDATRRMLEDLISGAGFRVRAAANGAEALRHVTREPPDVVVLDLVLPWVSGVEVLATLRNIPATEKTPVLVITGTNTGEFELRSFRPLTVMHKPLDVDTVLPAVRELLVRKF